MLIKEWQKESEDMEALRLKTAEKLSWRDMEYSQDGYLVGHGPGRKDLKVVPSYARDIKAAWDVIERLNQQGADVRISHPRKGIKEFAIEIRFPDGMICRAVHDRAAAAICMAFLESTRLSGYAASARK